MDKSERTFLKARLDAANREYEAQSHDKRVEHGLVRSDTDGQNTAADVRNDEGRRQPNPAFKRNTGS